MALSMKTGGYEPQSPGLESLPSSIGTTLEIMCKRAGSSIHKDFLPELRSQVNAISGVIQVRSTGWEE